MAPAHLVLPPQLSWVWRHRGALGRATHHHPPRPGSRGTEQWGLSERPHFTERAVPGVRVSGVSLPRCGLSFWERQSPHPRQQPGQLHPTPASAGAHWPPSPRLSSWGGSYNGWASPPRAFLGEAVQTRPARARASSQASGFYIPHQDPCFLVTKRRPRGVKHLAQEHTATDQEFSPLNPPAYSTQLRNRYPTLPLTSLWPLGSYLTSLCRRS